MCISAAVVAGVSLAVAAGSTIMQIDNANYQHKMLLLQQEEQLKQLTGQRIDAEQAGLEAQLARVEEYERQRAANLSAMAAQTGFGQNMGFLQGIDKASQKALQFDLTNIRMGVAGEQNRITGSERQLGFQRSISSANRKSAVVGSLLNFAGSAVQAGNIMGTYGTPGGSAQPKLGSTGGNNTGSWGGAFGGGF